MSFIFRSLLLFLRNKIFQVDRFINRANQKIDADALNRLQKRGTSQELVVIVHGYCGSAHGMRYVEKHVADKYPNADIYLPDLPHATMMCFTSPLEIVQLLLDAIDSIWAKQQHKKIILVGTSAGGLFVRKLYVHACGQNEKAPFEKAIKSHEPKPWVTKVERLILLAGMNRGWAITPQLSYQTAFVFGLGTALARILNRLYLRHLMLYLYRGAPFITELRVQWIFMREHNKDKGIPPITTIQLLGTIDDLVSPEDNIDLISGADFIYLDVPHSGHSGVLQMDETELGRARAKVFIAALTQPSEVLMEMQEVPADHTELIAPRPDITDVVFVIHGIRDTGYWTHKIARRIKSKVKQQKLKKNFASETSSYGYFPIIDFLIPGGREKKMHWLMDQYVEALALYPKADFSYVGHSNGTFLLARALEQYECCRFKHVVFASSVVRTDYDWDTPIKKGKVKAMLNFVATADSVVAFAPYCFETLGILNLGGAGHAGFQSKAIEQIEFVEGGHSASREEGNWDSIADFIINGPPGVKAKNIIRPAQSGKFKFAALIGRYGFFLLFATAITYGVGWRLWGLISGNDAVFAALFIFLYGSVVLKILKKF